MLGPPRPRQRARWALRLHLISTGASHSPCVIALANWPYLAKQCKSLSEAYAWAGRALWAHLTQCRLQQHPALQQPCDACGQPAGNLFALRKPKHFCTVLPAVFASPADHGDPRRQQHREHLELAARLCDAAAVVCATLSAITLSALMLWLLKSREEQQVQASRSAPQPAPSQAAPTHQAPPAPAVQPAAVARPTATAAPSSGAGAAGTRMQPREHRQHGEEIPLPIAVVPWFSLLFMPLLLAKFGNFGRPI